MSNQTHFIRAVLFLLVSLACLMGFASIAQAQAENKFPGEVKEVLATRQVKSAKGIRGEDSFNLVLALMDPAGVTEKQLPPDIPFREPRLAPYRTRLLTGPKLLKQSSERAKPPVAKAEAAPILVKPPAEPAEPAPIPSGYFGGLIGNQMFLLYQKPALANSKPVTVPIYGLNSNVDLGRATNNGPSFYSGSIATTGDQSKLLVTLVASVPLGEGHIGVYQADLAEPAAHGLYQDNHVRVMTNFLLKPTPLISEREFRSPYFGPITSVDSILLKEDELLVIVRFAGGSGTRDQGALFEKHFRLNPQTKEWQPTENKGAKESRFPLE